MHIKVKPGLNFCRILVYEMLLSHFNSCLSFLEVECNFSFHVLLGQSVVGLTSNHYVVGWNPIRHALIQPNRKEG